MHTKAELLAAAAAGRTLVAARGPWAGQRVVHDPQPDTALGNPDFYPWRVMGGGTGARVNHLHAHIQIHEPEEHP